MNPSKKLRVLAMLMFCVIGVSCKETGKVGASEEELPPEEERARQSNRGMSTGRKRPELRSSDQDINDWLSELRETPSPNTRRDLFGKILLELPTDEHEIALATVIEDLNSEAPANLLAEYLELSSFLSPVLQLPGIVRLLDEPHLPLLQREAMEHQLREELGLKSDEEISDWRPLVEAHLKVLPGVLVE